MKATKRATFMVAIKYKYKKIKLVAFPLVAALKRLEVVGILYLLSFIKERRIFLNTQ